jgi:hypothetical protein
MRVRWTGSESCVCGGQLREPGTEYDLDEALVGDLIARGLVEGLPGDPPKASSGSKKAAAVTAPVSEEN